MSRSKSIAVIAAAAGLAFAAQASAQTEVILMEGDLIDGSAVDLIGAPKVDAEGNAGLIFGLEDGRRGIWRGGSAVFFDTDPANATLSGGETTIGIGNGGAWVYSTSIDLLDGAGDGDGIWSSDGFIIKEDTPAPDFPAGFNSTFHSRPYMTDAGTMYWVSGLNDGAGGTSSQERMLYKRDAGTGAITTVLRAGDIIGATEVAPFGGINFDYSFSYDDAHSILEYNDANQAGAADGTIAVNMTVVAQEGSATGQGDNWDNFDYKAINDSGNWLLSGDTDGATSSDEFLAYNGTIALREGDSVDGVTLGGFVRSVALNNANEAAYVWSDDASSSIEHLFFAADASDVAAASALLSTGDAIDTDGDGVADAVVTDFNAFNNGDISLRNDGWVYLDVDLDDLAGNDLGEAAIRVRIPAPAGVLAMGAAGLIGLRRRR